MASMKDMLGAPSEKEGKSKGKKPSYLDSKSPELVTYLLDATGGDEKRAEALCRAIEMGAAPAEEPEELPEAPPMGGPELF